MRKHLAPFFSSRQLLPRLIHGSALWMLLASLTACGGGNDEGVACTLEVRPALRVEPVDGLGQALPKVQISWRVNGGS
ncbi:hypothetical protein HNQ51_002709 [Inhella inkyongensis]|uniref:Uncharacterized protein n=1 Tax=Inhella inkyongensis TaxID=392593 RepID=A0A840SAI6_9BURK|nr:hypothetical protein [Inhella inkyongensis]MBB5205390.1 hypothetical protein [Inhella inkyongensis]